MFLPVGRRRPRVFHFGRTVLVPSAQHGTDERKQLVDVLFELSRQTDHTASGFALTTRRGQLVPSDLGQQRIAEMYRLVSASPGHEITVTAGHAGSAIPTAPYFSILRQTRCGFNHFIEQTRSPAKYNKPLTLYHT